MVESGFPSRTPVGPGRAQLRQTELGEFGRVYFRGSCQTLHNSHLRKCLPRALNEAIASGT